MRPRAVDGTFYDQVYALVRTIPPGHVTTYGAVSEALVGHARAARSVGWALGALPESQLEDVPWWRVINAKGRISISRWPDAAEEQRAHLEAEGVPFGPDDRTDLERYGWWFAG